MFRIVLQDPESSENITGKNFLVVFQKLLEIDYAVSFRFQALQHFEGWGAAGFVVLDWGVQHALCVIPSSELREGDLRKEVRDLAQKAVIFAVEACR